MQAAQNAQRDSQELFQYLYFRDRPVDDDCCVVDAVIFQLRANGLLVFIPRFVSQCVPSSKNHLKFYCILSKIQLTNFVNILTVVPHDDFIKHAVSCCLKFGSFESYHEYSFDLF